MGVGKRLDDWRMDICTSILTQVNVTMGCEYGGIVGDAGLRGHLGSSV